jgi:glycosyltransferase involved in cell wall biosynthesis
MQQISDQRKLRVVFIDHVARLSGGEIALLRVLPTLKEYVDVHVLLGEDGPLVDRLRQAGIATEVMNLSPRVRDVRKDAVRPGRLDMIALMALFPYVLRLSRRLRALDADIVHTNSLKAALYGGLAARLAGMPAVWHIRDRIAPDYIPPAAVTLVRLASRVVPSAVVAVSQTTLSALQGGARETSDGWFVVPDAIDPPRRPAVVRPSSRVIGMVGRLAPWKGQNVFLDAFAEAFRDSSVLGRMIGAALFGENAYAESLLHQVERLGISGQIEFRGFRDDVWAELDELDVLVHCSVTPEPFGQVVLEGMAAGLPVIASRSGGPLEMITDGVEGLLVTPGAADELAAALVRLEQDDALRSRLGDAARRRSLEFSPDRSARGLLAVYEFVGRDVGR